jgi:hypothetical protein
MSRNTPWKARASRRTKCGEAGELKANVIMPAAVAAAQFVVASIRCRHTSMCMTTAR